MSSSLDPNLSYATKRKKEDIIESKKKKERLYYNFVILSRFLMVFLILAFV